MKTGIKIVGFIWFLLTSCQVMAGSLPLHQQREVLAKINAMAASVESITTSFTQTKYASLLQGKMTSEGRMTYKKPNKLRWEYTVPSSYLFVFNGTKVYAGQTTHKMLNSMARLMMNTVTGAILSDTANFEITVLEEKADWMVILTPKKKEAQKMFAKVVLSFHQTTLLMDELTIYEKNEDRTVIKIQNIRTNVPIDDRLFEIPK